VGGFKTNLALSVIEVVFMAIIRMKKLREMPDKEAGERLKELRLELSKERASSEIGTVKNPGRIREIRRSIARVMFEQGRRKTAANKAKDKSGSKDRAKAPVQATSAKKKEPK
jgi:large subunit ribosomal protein L29